MRLDSLMAEGGIGINTQLIVEAKLAGMIGSNAGFGLGKLLGASVGVATGPRRS